MAWIAQVELALRRQPLERSARGDGWVMARVAEVPEVITQDKTVEDARSMVRSALRDWLEFYVREQAAARSRCRPGRAARRSR